MNPSDCGGHPLEHPTLADFAEWRRWLTESGPTTAVWVRSQGPTFTVKGDWDSYRIPRRPHA